MLCHFSWTSRNHLDGKQRTRRIREQTQHMDQYRDALSIELLSVRLQAERAGGQATCFTLSTLAVELQDHRASTTRLSRCSARRWRCTARPSAIGIRTRSPPYSTSVRCRPRATSPSLRAEPPHPVVLCSWRYQLNNWPCRRLNPA